MQAPVQCLLLLLVSFLHTIAPCYVTTPLGGAHLLREYCALPKKKKRSARDPDCPFTLMFRMLPACQQLLTAQPVYLTAAAVKASRAGDSLSLFFAFFFFYSWGSRYSFGITVGTSKNGILCHLFRTHQHRQPGQGHFWSSRIPVTFIKRQIAFCFFLLCLSHFFKLVRASFRHRRRERERLCFHPALTPTILLVLFCVLPKC